MPARARIALDLSGMIAGVGVRESRAAVRRQVHRRRRRALDGVEPTGFDPLDPAVVADPYPWYEALLAGGPVHYSAAWHIWIVSRYEDVRAGARAHEELSSAESVTRLRSRVPMMLTMDRPEHARLRRLVARDFTSEALERWRPAIERLAREAINEMCEPPAGEAVSQLASPLPVAVIAHVLGVPPEDLPDFRRWSDQVVEGFAVGASATSLRSSVHVLGAVVRLHTYLRRHFERKRSSPGDDVLSRLLASSEEGALTEDELFWFAVMLLVAGNETTSNLLGTMLLSFARHPDQYARVRDDPTLIPSAVEESLRYVSPIQGMYRTALADHEVDGAKIPAGSRVLLLFGAANRDHRHYPEPNRFDVARNPTDHMAFGSGIHFCLGAHLARLEGAVVLGELVSRARAIELGGEPVWNDNPTLRGLRRLPVRLA